VFDDFPGLDTLIDSTVIDAAGIYLLYRESQKMRDPLGAKSTVI
jgi:hypothetical protein